VQWPCVLIIIASWHLEYILQKAEKQRAVQRTEIASRRRDGAERAALNADPLPHQSPSCDDYQLNNLHNNMLLNDNNKYVTVDNAYNHS